MSKSKTPISRREILIGGAATVAVAGLSLPAAGQQGYRVVAHDRRGHGRSEQTWTGNEYDTFADDLAELVEKLDLKDVTLVGHSMGGGEVTRYIGRHGNKRVKKVVIIGGIPPVMLKSDKNPGGLPMSVFDGIRAGLVADRSQFYKDVSAPFYVMAITSLMQSSRRVFAICSGSRECNPRSLPLMNASRLSRRLISRKI